MFCKNCGMELPEGSNVCSSCGTPQEVSYQKKRAKSDSGVAGLVLGIIGLFAWFIPIIGYAVSIPGLVICVKQLKEGNRDVKVILGLVFCSICLGASLINSILGVLLYS